MFGLFSKLGFFSRGRKASGVSVAHAAKREQRNREKGEIGEYDVNKELDTLCRESGYAYFSDVYVGYENKRSNRVNQIDHIVVSVYGIFAIETKNWGEKYKEVEIVEATEDKWIEKKRVAKQKHRRYELPPDKNPLCQNKKHCWALRDFLNQHSKRAFGENLVLYDEEDVTTENENLFSVIVFSGEGIILPKKREQREPAGLVHCERLCVHIQDKHVKKFSRKKFEFLVDVISNHVNHKERYPKLMSTHSKNWGGDESANEKSQAEFSKKIAPSPKVSKPAAATFADISAEKSAYEKKRRKNIAYAIAGVSTIAMGGWYLQSKTQSANIISPPSAESSAPVSAAKNLREQFMQELTEYESDAEPKLAALRASKWAAVRYAELADLKTRAIEHFTASDYLAARESLRLARAGVDELAAEHSRRLAELQRAAADAFENGYATEAEQAVRRALELQPDDAAMRALQPRIAVMAEVLELLRRADAARAENRPAREIAALEKILILDAARATEAARLKTLRAEFAKTRYADALRGARRALDAGNLTAAEKQIAIAKNISPAGAEIAPLQKDLQQARAQQEFKNEIAAGERAAQRDDWETAAANFSRAVQLQPNNKTALEKQRAARDITATMQTIRDHLAQPQRLENYKTADAVAAYAREVAPRINVSAGLQKLHAELMRTVSLYQTEIEVTVVSDGKTHVIVRGIGEVGATERRAIRLRPGKRVFEGSRAGYKSKLIALNIKPGAAAAEVTVICDEKI